MIEVWKYSDTLTYTEDEARDVRTAKLCLLLGKTPPELDNVPYVRLAKILAYDAADTEITRIINRRTNNR